LVTNLIENHTNSFLHVLKEVGVNTTRDVNKGWCLGFAEFILLHLENENYTSAEMLTNDYLVEGEELPDSSYVENFDEKEMAKYQISMNQYTAFKELVTKRNPNGIIGYHAWLYDRKTQKHYDIECPKGVENVFDLPFFTRQIQF